MKRDFDQHLGRRGSSRSRAREQMSKRPKEDALIRGQKDETPKIDTITLHACEA